jgi:hypothetical protein
VNEVKCVVNATLHEFGIPILDVPYPHSGDQRKKLGMLHKGVRPQHQCRYPRRQNNGWSLPSQPRPTLPSSAFLRPRRSFYIEQTLEPGAFTIKLRYDDVPLDDFIPILGFEYSIGLRRSRWIFFGGRPHEQTLIDEIAAWEHNRNTHHTKSDWHFTTKDARIKLKHLYPSI